MPINPKADCANSSTGILTPQGISPGEQHTIECTRCHQQVPATADRDGYSTLFVHLRPGKTLADRL